MSTKRPAVDDDGDNDDTSPNQSPPAIRIGAVGYEFRKHFKGHGVFVGRVVEIRPGAMGGKDRRCQYEDGDVEDLSLSQLHKLEKTHGRPRASATEQREKNWPGSSGEVGGAAGGGAGAAAGGSSVDKPKRKKQKKQSTSSSAVTASAARMRGKRTGTAKNACSGRQQKQDLFDGLESLVPIDRAAEATLSRASARGSAAGSVSGDIDGSRDTSLHGGVAEQEEDETGAWLAKVAVALGASRDRSRIGGPGGTASSSGTSRSAGRKRTSNQTSPCASRSMSPPPPRLVQSDSVGGGDAAAPEAKLKADQSTSLLSFASCGIGSDFSQSALARPPPQMLVPRSSSPSSSVSMDYLSSLADIARGVRHGTRVFRASDKKRLVGEVILEHGGGYVEVIVGKSVEKGRLREFIIAPEEFQVGDTVPLHLQLPIYPGQIKGPKGSAGNKGRLKKKEGEPRMCRQISAQGSVSSGKLPHRNALRRTGSREAVLTSPSKRASVSSTVAVPSSPGVGDDTVSPSDLFYWCCDLCTMANNYTQSKCSACNRRKNCAAKTSALLEVASVAVAAAKNVEEAREMIPIYNQDAVPEIVLFNLISLRERKDVSDGASQAYPPAPTNLDAYFYWICGFCTLKNSYRRPKCSGCHQRKAAGSASSAVLEIAIKASEKAHNVSEAINAVPIEDRRSIPDAVLFSLITCIAIVGSRKSEQHRCRNAKAPGVDYCSYHCNDPLLLSTGEVCASLVASDTAPRHVELSLGKQASDRLYKGTPKNFLSLSTSLSQFLDRSRSTPIANELRWNLRCTEDAILCQEGGPFPLGLLVRKFFTHYGFHDGRIIKALRQNILDPESGRSRPVLVYRVLYNDGDCEDFMHHEINSLRQVYDRCNVDPKAHPEMQITKGSLFETHNDLTPIVMIEGHTTPSDIRGLHPNEGGLVDIKFCQAIGHPWTLIQADLKKLQTNVIRMLPPAESIVVGPAQGSSLVEDEEVLEYDADLCLKQTPAFKAAVTSNTSLRIDPAPSSRSIVSAPILEWPGVHAGGAKAKAHNQGFEEASSESDDGDDDSYEITSELWLTKRAEKDTSELFDGGKCSEVSSSFTDDECCVRSCLSRPQAGWDPANASPFVRWDPFKNIVCHNCNIDKDDHQILLCDGCHLGFHMYCVRPVIVNVPTGEWLCSRCKRGREDDTKPFSAFLAELEKGPNEAIKFLHLSYNEPNEFYSAHKEGLELFSPDTKPTTRRQMLGTSKSTATAKVGSISFSWNIGKDDLVIPRPPSSPDTYSKVILSWVAAMKYVGMSAYCEELVYPGVDNGGASESMNDANLEEMEPLSLRNLQIFKEYKENLKRGAFPPIQVVHDPNVGFTVEALEPIRKHTLIAEYIGEVTTTERSGETSSDSLMMLLDTGDDNTSLIIDPTRRGNVARFLSGINNRSNLSKKKANVRTRRFALNGKCHVVLFTAKKIEAGEKLHYDYNAGVEGKSVVEWAKGGFYDTSNFF